MEKQNTKTYHSSNIDYENIEIKDGKYNFLDVCRYLKTKNFILIGNYLGFDCRCTTESGKQGWIEKKAKEFYITKEQFEDIQSKLEDMKNYITFSEIKERYGITAKTIQRNFGDYVIVDPIRQIRVMKRVDAEKYIVEFLDKKASKTLLKKKKQENKDYIPNWEDFDGLLTKDDKVCLNDVFKKLNTKKALMICAYFNINATSKFNSTFSKYFLTKDEFEKFSNDYKTYLTRINIFEVANRLKTQSKTIEELFPDCVIIDNYTRTKMVSKSDYDEKLKPFFIKKDKDKTPSKEKIKQKPIIKEKSIFDNIQEFNLDKKPITLTKDDVLPIFEFRKLYVPNVNIKTIANYLEESNFYCFYNLNKKSTVALYILKRDIQNIIEYLNDMLNGYSFKSMLKILGIIDTQPLFDDTRKNILNETFEYIKPKAKYIIKKSIIDEYVNKLKKNKDVPFILVGKTKNNSMHFTIYKEPICNELLKKYDKGNYIKTLKSIPLDIEGGIIINDKDFANLDNIMVDGVEYVNIKNPYITKELGENSISPYRTFYDTFKMVGSNSYVSKKEVDKVIAKNKNCINLHDLWEFCANKINLTLEDKTASFSYYSIEELFDDGVVDFFQKAGYQKEKVYFFQTNNKEKELEDIAETIIDAKIKGMRTIYEPYRTYKLNRLKIKYLNKEILYKYLMEFYDFKVNNEYLDKYSDSGIIATFTKIMELLDNDILLISTEKAINIATQLETYYSRYIFKDFLDFLKTKYNVKYDNFVVKQLKEITLDDEDKIYSKEEWENLIIYLVNIDKHIEKAFDNINYSRGWFFYLMGIAMPWRHIDIMNLPKLSIDTSKYTLDWFKNNDFTISDAQYIISNYKDYAERTLIKKTQEQKHFIVPNAIIIPFAIALIILNNWTNDKFDKDNLFAKVAFDFKVKELFDNETIQSFSMLKANRCFITFGNEYAAHSVKFSYGGYALLGQARGHKINEMGYSETTAIYVNSIDNDGDINEISLGMFNRGIFGWLYYTLIKMTTDVDKLKFCDINHIIDSIKKEFNAIGIENISGWINNEALSRQSILQNIATMDEKDIKSFLETLNHSYSKTDNILCSLMDSSQNCSLGCCPNPLTKNCTLCKYSIPTTYSLLNISNELIDLLKKSNELPDNDIFHKQIYANHILKFLSIIGQAKLSFDDLDKNYISAYLKLDEIKPLIAQNKLLKGE